MASPSPVDKPCSFRVPSTSPEPDERASTASVVSEVSGAAMPLLSPQSCRPVSRRPLLALAVQEEEEFLPIRPFGLAINPEEEEACAGIATMKISDEEIVHQPKAKRGGVLGGILNEVERRKLFAYLDRHNYQLGDELGRGQSGIVFRLEGEGQGKVLKIFLNDPSIPAATVVDGSRGSHLIAALEHDAIISPKCALVAHEEEITHTLTEGNKIIGYIYPYVPGEDLSEVIRRKALTQAQIFKYGAEIGNALQALHARGVFHRDIKPANVRISDDCAKLMDFDLARVIPYPCEPHVSPKGTKAFRAPEASTPGAYSTQSEAWSLGVVLYQMAFHKLPFENEWDAASEREVDLPHDIHPELQRIIKGLLKKDPSARMSLEEGARRLETAHVRLRHDAAAAAST